MLLEGVVKALINLPSSEVTAAKHNLTSHSVRMSRNRQGIRKRAKTMSTAKNIPYVTDKDGELIPGLLLYLMEGILPMLKVHKIGDNVVCTILLFVGLLWGIF